MTRNRVLGLFIGVSLLCVMPARAQESRPASERPGSSSRDVAAEPASFAVSGSISQEAQVAAPRVLKFSGVLLDASGKPVNGEVEVTFDLYKQEGDEEALWTETQRVVADDRGGYTAFLGAKQATGMPTEVFRSDEARWLGVQVQGQAQQPRTMLVTVPYALKAVEAEKLAGKSASDFVLSESLGDQVRRVIEGQNIVASQATSPGLHSPVKPRHIARRLLRRPRAQCFRPARSAGRTPHRSCRYSRMAAVMDCTHRLPAALETAGSWVSPPLRPLLTTRTVSSASMPAQALAWPG